MRVLVVEDEARLAAFIQKGLTEQGLVVDVGSDGESALERISSGHYDLVILDVMLPGIDGFSVCRGVRARHRDLPVPPICWC